MRIKQKLLQKILKKYNKTNHSKNIKFNLIYRIILFNKFYNQMILIFQKKKNLIQKIYIHLTQ